MRHNKLQQVLNKRLVHFMELQSMKVFQVKKKQNKKELLSDVAYTL